MISAYQTKPTPTVSLRVPVATQFDSCECYVATSAAAAAAVAAAENPPPFNLVEACLVTGGFDFKCELDHLFSQNDHFWEIVFITPGSPKSSANAKEQAARIEKFRNYLDSKFYPVIHTYMHTQNS